MKIRDSIMDSYSLLTWGFWMLPLMLLNFFIEVKFT